MDDGRRQSQVMECYYCLIIEGVVIQYDVATMDATAVSSRGLGRGPLKAQTRVRIPLALLIDEIVWAPVGLIVYRLGRHPFTVQRGVRFPLGLLQNGLIDTQSGYKEGAR